MVATILFQGIFLYIIPCAFLFNNVDVSLQTNWNQHPLIAQAGEFISDVDSSLYWDFFEYYSECTSDNSSDLDDFNCVLKFCSQNLPFGYSHLYGFVEGLQYYSPRIQMYKHMLEEYSNDLDVIPQSCLAFIVLCDKIVCDTARLLDYLPKNSSTCNSNSINVGHKSDLSPYNVKNSSNSLIAVVYGPFGRQVTTDIFVTIYSLAQRGFLAGFVYRPWYITDSGRYPVLLSGYGVELAIKSTEYHTVDDRTKTNNNSKNISERRLLIEIGGLNFDLLNTLHARFFEQLYLLQNHLIGIHHDLLPLKKWQISDLGLQVCQWLINTFPEKGVSALEGLVELIKFFPVECKHLYLLEISDELRKEITYNLRVLNNFGIENGQNLFVFNGRLFRNLDPFNMVSFLFSELSLFSKLQTLGVSPTDIHSLIQLDFPNEELEYGIDTRHDCIYFINDIENDVEYSSWTTNLFELLRPTFPGVIRQIRRNFFDLVVCFDPSEASSYYLVKSVEYFFTHLIPVKIGLILLPSNSLDIDKREILDVFACYFSFLSKNISTKYGFNWLLDITTHVFSTNQSLSVQELSNHFHSYTRSRFLGSLSCSVSVNLPQEFIHSKGLFQVPFILLNGVPLTFHLGTHVSEDMISIIKDAIFYQTRILQRDIYFSHLVEGMDVRNFIMTKSNIVSRLNYRILSGNWKTIDFFCFKSIQLSWFDEIFSLSTCEIFRLFAKSTPYISNTPSKSQIFPLSLWLVADLSSVNGFQFLLDSLEMLSIINTVRVSLIFNEPPTSEFTMNKLVLSLIQSQDEQNLLLYLRNLQNFTSISRISLEDSLQYYSKLKDFDRVKFIQFALSDTYGIVARNHYFLASHVFNLTRNCRALIANGHVLETISNGDVFSVKDFLFLERYFYSHFSENMLTFLDVVNFQPSLAQESLFRNISSISSFNSDIFLYLSTIFFKKQETQRIKVPYQELRSKYSLLKIPPRFNDMYFFRFDVIVDPLSNEAQKLLPFLLTLFDTFNVYLHIWLCPLQRISVMPIKRFYTYLLSSKPIFESNGSLSRKYPRAGFSNLPISPLLNLLLDIPHVWVVELTESGYDLDNLAVSPDSADILATFTLSYILLEGNCYDYSTNEPVPGLQLNLGTSRTPENFDSLVMQNLGYFQLKFFPGLWKLHIMEKQSLSLYSISKQNGERSFLINETIFVYCDSLLGANIKIFVSKRPRTDDIVDHNSNYGLSNEVSNRYNFALDSIWQSVSYLLPNSQLSTLTSNEIVPGETINIFSIASGHLYERFLRIMIISVLKHTNNPVKLWLLKQYLSPNFKDSFPKLARHYKFTYEFVEYKWPEWLRKQEEKQREIWGYKILFLDVLFPMHLDRIIYVDADQIVRTDLLELVHLDLHSAPYAYTPFCDSKKEMDGFRFWKHGYWNNLLGKRKYHISALYVVDLSRFRQLGAGDKLRANYQALSQDPNSLANLDQDLPNSMIDSVPIFSLPQDWLWCETWCSDEYKSRAKTIDMCNNPLTKEPKLTAARRIASEWIEYDQEAMDILSKSESENIFGAKKHKDTRHTEL